MTKERSAWLKNKWLWMPFSLFLIVGLVLVGTIIGQGGTTAKPGTEEPSQQPAPDQEELAPAEEPEAPPSVNPKLDSALNQLLEAHNSGGMPEAQAFAASRAVTLDGNQVLVEIVAMAEGMTALQEAVQAAGGEYRGHYQDLMEATVPIEALDSLAARAEVLLIRQPQQAMPAISE